MRNITEYTLEWIYQGSSLSQRTALLIPFYNEASDKEHFLERLYYYQNLSEEVADCIDVVLINDGSSDETLSLLRTFSERAKSVNIASVTPNGQKVGALNKVSKELENHDYVIYSDFDTDLVGLGHFKETIKRLDSDEMLMGCYFKMYPMDGTTPAIKFQIIEYSLERIMYRFVESENSVAVMPGAGCVYNRKLVQSLLDEHSGERSGEDRETNMLLQAKGYGVFYERNIHAVTKAPDKLSILYNQRTRWSLGFLENVFNKNGLFVKQLFSFSRMGLMNFYDILSVTTFMVMPLFFILFILTQSYWPLLFPALYFGFNIVATLVTAYIGRDELAPMKHRFIYLILMPFMRVLLETPCWWLATRILLKKKLQKV